jgi:hypothetical protein
VAPAITCLKCSLILFVGMLKEKVCMNNPQSLEELQANIRHDIPAIPIEELQHVSKNSLSCEACLNTEGRHFEILLLNNYAKLQQKSVSRVDHSVQRLTKHWATGVRSPTEVEDFSSIICIQTGSGAHPASYTMGTGGSSPGIKCGRGGMLTTHALLVQSLRMSRAIPPLTQSVSMACSGATFITPSEKRAVSAAGSSLTINCIPCILLVNSTYSKLVVLNIEYPNVRLERITFSYSDYNSIITIF